MLIHCSKMHILCDVLSRLVKSSLIIIWEKFTQMKTQWITDLAILLRTANKTHKYTL